MIWLHAHLWYPLIHFVQSFKYTLLIIASLVEGPLVIITSGVLLREGMLKLVPLVSALVIGDVAGDVLWYVLGRYGLRSTIASIQKFFGISDATFEKVKSLFHKHKEYILFGSKVTLGLGVGIGVMLAAGYSHIPFKRFLIINILGSIVMVLALMMIGYFFGEVFLHVDGITKVIFGGLLFAAVVGIVIMTVRSIRASTLESK